MKRSLPIILFLFFSFLNKGEATIFIDLKTGGENSASWNYTKSLSTLWNTRFQDEPINFIPNPGNQWEDRLHSLLTGSSRFMIAPLQDESSDFFSDSRVRIVSTLWRVFLVPISKKQLPEILEYSKEAWLIPENSIILSSFANSKTPLQSKDESKLSEFQQSAIQTNSYKSIKREALIRYLKVAFEEESLQETEGDITLEDGMDEKVFFIEMVGPTEKLMKKIDPVFFAYGLHKKFQQQLVTTLPWLSGTYFTYKNKKRRNTVRYTMALYTLKDEESEFIEQLAELIASPPTSSFSHPYLVKYRSTSMTKEIPPQLLHEGTRKYYKIEYTPPIEEVKEESAAEVNTLGIF